MVTGFIAGTWDLLHAGHVLAFEIAKQSVDKLYVGLQSKSTKREPIQGLFERYMQLRGCKFVDDIIPYSTELDLYNLLASLKDAINYRFLDENYAKYPDKIIGADLIPIKYISRKHDFSTTKIIADIRYGRK